MTFKFTYQPLNRISGVKPSTGTAETAKECLRQVHGLEMSDERVTDITTPSGRVISKRELELMASDEG